MSQLQFNEFIFDTHSLSLKRAGIRETVRPKTALLLSVLIENRDRIISKRELFELVWKTEYVQDHTLFQIISEIRKLSPKSELIRTQPNQGYQWVARTKRFEPMNLNLSTKLVTAASIACFCASFYLLTPNQPRTKKLTTSYSTTLPAASAYSKGVLAFEKGELEKAEQWLRFSLAENPASIDVQLLLAESLLQQDKLADSESIAQSLLHSPNKSKYGISAAAELLSRIYQRQGSVYNALEYAIKGSKGLDPSQAVCTAEAIDLRIQKLSSMLDNQFAYTVMDKTTILEQSIDYSFAKNDSLKTVSQNPEAVDRCAQLIQELPTNEISDCSKPYLAPYSSIKYVAKENLLLFSQFS